MAVVTRNAQRGQRRLARLRALTWSLAIVPLTVTCVALAIAFAAEELYADRALPGVTVAGIDVGSLTRAPMVERLQTELSHPWAEGTIAATYDGRSWRATNGALGVQPDVDAAAEAALSYGKTGSVLAAQTLQDRDIALSVRAVYPAVDESGFNDALAKATAATTPLTISVEDRRVAEDGAGLASLLVIDRVLANPGELSVPPAGAIVPNARFRYTVSVDESRLSEWVKALGVRLDRPAVSAKYSVSRENVVTVVPGVAGIRLEQERMRALMRDDLFRPIGLTLTGTRELAAPSASDTSAFSTQQAQEWLPKLARTSTFTTYFPVSQSRHANIATGASQFDGVVIMPGQTFSFWNLLGPVTVERGYAFAGAIIQNRSDENVIGGGLCQVSTTMFNAISTLGYQIDERHAHGYLIERYPLGLDAAVFDPGVDFKWTNDTATPVFLWSWVSDTSVTFDVWGLPTGRTVTFSDPVQRNFIDVPAEQPADVAFPKGYSIRGRDVIRVRTVVESGKVVHQDTFFSHYAPVWGGVAVEGQSQIVR